MEKKYVREDGELAVAFPAYNLPRAHRRENEASLLVQRLAIGAHLDIFFAVPFLGDRVGVVFALPDIGDIGRSLFGLGIPFVDAVGDQIAEGEKASRAAVVPDRALEELVIFVDLFDSGVGGD